MLRRTIFWLRSLAGLALALAVLPLPAPARAETFVGSNVDSRVVAGFRVDDAAAQAWLPDGWTLAAFPKGPFAGANVLIVLIDSYVVLDPDGKPATPPNYRSAALVSLGQGGADETRLFVTRVYINDPTVNPYKNAIGAQIDRSASVDVPAGAVPTRSEQWTVAPEVGGELSLSMSYEAANPSWAAHELLPYSAVEPDFHRIYRYDQLTDLVMSAPLDRNAAGRIDFSTTIPELAPMFDGSEEMIGVVGVPVYVRKLYLP